MAGFCYTVSIMESLKVPETKNEGATHSFSDQVPPKKIASVSESHVSVSTQIRELKEKIRELEEGKERVALLQRTYAVPKEGLTEGDLTTLEASDAELKEKLSVLLEQKRNTPSLVRKLARRAAAFLSL